MTRTATAIRSARQTVIVCSWVGLLALASACGYRPLTGTLPGGGRTVRVVQPDPSRTDEPGLPAMLTAELCRQLSRAGIAASTVGRAQAVLHTKILRLDARDPMLSGARSVTAQRLQLRLELALFDAGEQRALWRSGLLEVEAAWPMVPVDPLRTEAARRNTLERLAAEAARRAVTSMTLAR